MRIIIKPFGMATIVLAVLSLALLAFRSHDGAGISGGSAAAASVGATAAGAADSAVIYDGKLENGWESYGWARVIDWNDRTHARPGRSACIRVEPDGFQAIYFHHAPFVPAGVDRITFLINGGDRGGQVVRVDSVFAAPKSGKYSDNATYGMTLRPLEAQTWRPVTLRLSDFGVRGRQKINGFWVQNVGSGPIPAFYLDDLRFLRPHDADPATGPDHRNTP